MTERALSTTTFSPERLATAVGQVLDYLTETSRLHVWPCPNFGVEFKKGKERVTTADQNASQCLLDRVRPTFPGSYSEEHIYADRFSHQLIWQFDPIDGTDEYIEGVLHGFAMHAALLQKKGTTYQPIAGIIYQPSRDLAWVAYPDGRVVRLENGQETRQKQIETPTQIRGYFRSVDPNDLVKDFYTQLGGKLKLPVELVAGGGAGASIVSLLEGEINLVVMNYDYTKEWDLAMAEPIIRAKGGFICDLAGNEFTHNRQDPYNRNGYVISIGFKKEEIIPYIPKGLLIRKLLA